jgi:hypothetical protein
MKIVFLILTIFISYTSYCQKDVNILDSNNLKQGLWIEYIDDGKMKTEVNYVDGIANGFYRTYRQDGSLYGSGFKLDGQIHGDFVSYDKTGKRISHTKWDNGRLIDSEILNSDTKETGTVEIIDGEKYVWMFGELKKVVE